MELKSLRDFAKEKNITIRAVQKHVKNHEGELKGHVVRYGPPRGSFLDEYAQEFISDLLVGHQVEVMDNALSEEIERLQAELAEANKRIMALLDERTALTERALQAESQKALAEATSQDQEQKVLDQEQRILALEEKLTEAQELNQKLKGRSLWQRITRRWE